MSKRRDERRAAERAAKAAEGVVTFEPPTELTGLEVENPPPPSTVAVTEVDHERGEVTVESAPASVEEAIDRLAESVVEETGELVAARALRLVRFVASVACGEARSRETLTAIVGDAGIERIGVEEHGVRVTRPDRVVFVPWGNVREVVWE